MFEWHLHRHEVFVSMQTKEESKLLALIVALHGRKRSTRGLHADSPRGVLGNHTNQHEKCLVSVCVNWWIGAVQLLRAIQTDHSEPRRSLTKTRRRKKLTLA